MSIPYFLLWVVGVWITGLIFGGAIRVAITTPAVNKNQVAKAIAVVFMFFMLACLVAPYFWALLNVGPK
jgi:hypothetical protein